MKDLTLTRIFSQEAGTWGKLQSNGSILAHTLELPWRNNLTNLSCIPTGKYPVIYNYSPAFKRDMYLLLNVQGRSGIRIHAGNWAGASDKGYRTDFLGCIGLGRGINWDGNNSQFMLTQSAAAIAALERYLRCEPFVLNIVGEHDAI